MVTADGRYLVQLRDDFPHLRVPGHWGLFGGRVEKGETPKEALIRELMEELEFIPRRAAWFTESGFILPQFHVAATGKAFFEVPVNEGELEGMIQHEGAGRAAVCGLEDLLGEPEVVPWDLYGVLLHARRETVFRLPEENS